MKKVLMSALVVLGMSAAAGAAGQAYEPAGFGENTLSYLEAAVAQPELTQDAPVAAVYCQADVGTDGLTRNVSCYEREGQARLRAQVEEAFAGRQFTPAQVNGEPVPVRMLFRVVYADLEGQPPIMLLPNLGNNQGEYGYQYVAPQELLDEYNWYSHYRRNSWSEGQPFFSKQGELTRVLGVVNESGEVVVVRRIEAHGRHKRDAVEVEKALKQSRFIPGFVQGEPARMKYAAVLHYPQ